MSNPPYPSSFESFEKFTNSLSKAIFDQAPELWAPQASNLTALKDGYHTSLGASTGSGYPVGSPVRSERLVDVPGMEGFKLGQILLVMRA
jgi:hypothetical protein